MSREVLKKLYGLFKPYASKFDMFHVLVRYMWCPKEALYARLPRKGTAVDFGCGFAQLFAPEAAEGKGLRVIGIDMDLRKLSVAKKAYAGFADVQFIKSDGIPLKKADVIYIVDVMYLIPYEAQERIIGQAYDALSPGGILVIKDMNTKPRYKYLWNAFQEFISVKVIGITFGAKFYFRSEESYIKAVSRAGFGVKAENLNIRRFYPDVVYICRKPEEILSGKA